MDNIWIAEGWSAFLIAMLILKTYAVLLYLLVRSEVGVSGITHRVPSASLWIPPTLITGPRWPQKWFHPLVPLLP